MRKVTMDGDAVGGQQFGHGRGHGPRGPRGEGLRGEGLRGEDAPMHRMHMGHGRQDWEIPGFESHPGRGHFGGRARRGEVRYVMLDALRDGPKHGYEIVKTLEERSGGQYIPSPGTVYPTMQFLQEEGLIKADQEGDRRVFQLTDAGRAELEAHAELVQAFWARFTAASATGKSRHEVNFLAEDLESLNRTIWGSMRESIERGDEETIRRVRQAVERCRDEVRGIIGSTGGTPSSEDKMST